MTEGVSRVAFWGCVVLVVAHVASFSFIAFLRLHYPYDLEWMESGVLLHSRELLLGKNLYRPPSADFISFPYEPFYPVVVAVLARVFGLSFVVARTVSIVSTIAIALLVGDAVRRETESRELALFAGATVFALYGATGFWFDVGRVDMLFLALLLGGLHAARYIREPRVGAAVSALLFVLSYKTKQLALPFFLLVPPLLYPRSRRAALAFLPVMGAVLGVTYFLSQRASDGWYWFYVNKVARGQPYRAGDFVEFWIVLFSDVPVLVVFALAGASSVLKRRSILERARQVWPLATGLGLLVTLAAWAREGGWTNNFMTTYVPLIIPAFVGLRHFQLQGNARERALVYPLLAVQLLLLGYNPIARIPTPADVEAGQRVIELLRASPGPVLVPERPWLAVLAGKEPSYHTQAIWDLSFQEPKPVVSDLDARLAGNYYSLILLAADPLSTEPPIRMWPESLLRWYKCDRDVKLPGLAPMPITRTTPHVICRYSAEAASAATR